MLYTDGLIERRGASLDTGLARLEKLAAEPVRNPSELADRVVVELCQDLADDCCILIVHRHVAANE